MIYVFLIVMICLIFFVLGTVCIQSPCRISEEVVTIVTYPYKHPNAAPVLITDPRLYPYSTFLEYSTEGKSEDWTVVKLENEYISVYVLPGVGGKVWFAEVNDDRAFIYKNGVLKFRGIALRGPWTSGGIEFNFGIVGHAPSTAAQVNYRILKDENDGSVSVVVGDMDLPSRTFWRVEVRLEPGKSKFETRSTWYNPTPIRQPYYSWMNSAHKTEEDLQMCYPGTKYLGHNGDSFSWPVDSQGRDLSLYKNNGFGGSKSYHVVGKLASFFGSYYHQKGEGFGHFADYKLMPGKKAFLWSLSGAGKIWENLLTDTSGQYMEMQSGRLFVQSLPQSGHVNPIKRVFFDPHLTDKWVGSWAPIEGIGGISTMSSKGSMFVSVLSSDKEFLLDVGICSFESVKSAKLEVKRRSDSSVIYTRLFDLDPLHIFREKSIPLSDDDQVEITVDLLDLYWGNIPSETIDVDRPFTTDPSFWDLLPSYEKTIIEGRNLMAGRYFTEAISVFDSVLATNPWNRDALLYRAELYYRSGEFSKGLGLGYKLLQIDTYCPEANYLAGILYMATAKFVDAEDCFGFSSRSPLFKYSSYAHLAELGKMEEEDEEDEEEGDNEENQTKPKSLTDNPENINAQIKREREEKARFQNEFSEGEFGDFEFPEHESDLCKPLWEVMNSMRHIPIEGIVTGKIPGLGDVEIVDMQGAGEEENEDLTKCGTYGLDMKEKRFLREIVHVLHPSTPIVFVGTRLDLAIDDKMQILHTELEVRKSLSSILGLPKEMIGYHHVTTSKAALLKYEDCRISFDSFVDRLRILLSNHFHRLIIRNLNIIREFIGIQYFNNILLSSSTTKNQDNNNPSKDNQQQPFLNKKEIIDDCIMKLDDAFSKFEDNIRMKLQKALSEWVKKRLTFKILFENDRRRKNKYISRTTYSNQEQKREFSIDCIQCMWEELRKYKKDAILGKYATKKFRDLVEEGVFSEKYGILFSHLDVLNIKNPVTYIESSSSSSPNDENSFWFSTNYYYVRRAGMIAMKTLKSLVNFALKNNEKQSTSSYEDQSMLFEKNQNLFVSGIIEGIIINHYKNIIQKIKNLLLSSSSTTTGSNYNFLFEEVIEEKLLDLEFCLCGALYKLFHLPEQHEEHPSFFIKKGKLINKGGFGDIYEGFVTTSLEEETSIKLALKEYPKDWLNYVPKKIRLKQKREAHFLLTLDHKNLLSCWDVMGPRNNNTKVSCFYIGKKDRILVDEILVSNYSPVIFKNKFDDDDDEEEEEVDYKLLSILPLMTGDGHRIIFGSAQEKKYNFSLKQRLMIGKEIIEGVMKLHSMDICHRDLKLKNVLLKFERSEEGEETRIKEVKICDFGFAKKMDIRENDNKNLHSFWCGTERYCDFRMYFSKDSNYGVDVDIFSLGLILLELYLDRPYFQHKCFNFGRYNELRDGYRFNTIQFNNDDDQHQQLEEQTDFLDFSKIETKDDVGKIHQKRVIELVKNCLRMDTRRWDIHKVFKEFKMMYDREIQETIAGDYSFSVDSFKYFVPPPDDLSNSTTTTTTSTTDESDESDDQEESDDERKILQDLEKEDEDEGEKEDEDDDEVDVIRIDKFRERLEFSTPFIGD